MDYLWRKYSPQKRYALDLSMRYSAPSIEISQRRDNAVIVNPLPRFADIFYPLLRKSNAGGNQEQRIQALANCLFHYLAQLDRVSGTSVVSVAEEQIEAELLSGQFGNHVRQAYSKLNFEQKQTVLDFLYRQEKEEGRRLYFRETVKSIFPAARIYYYNPDGIFLIFLPQKENDADKECMELLVILFLDATAKWRIYWEYPFGIIGRKPTMMLNRMIMYGERKGQ